VQAVLAGKLRRQLQMQQQEAQGRGAAGGKA